MARHRPLAVLETILLIGLGGFAGVNLRYFAGLVVPSSLVATLLVNVIGSFALSVSYINRYIVAFSPNRQTSYLGLNSYRFL